MKREAGDGPFKKIVPLCENIFCKEGQIKEDLMTTWRQLKIERERICVRLSVSWREREREREREWRQTSIAYCVRVSDVGSVLKRERERERACRPLDVTAPKPETGRERGVVLVEMFRLGPLLQNTLFAICWRHQKLQQYWDASFDKLRELCRLCWSYCLH